MILNISNQEFNTILAALRFYQEMGQGDPENRSDAIHDIATDDGIDISLDGCGIDELCERLNASDSKLYVVALGDPFSGGLQLFGPWTESQADDNQGARHFGEASDGPWSLVELREPDE